MQRTVKGTQFTYAKTEIINGELKAELATIRVPETDPKRAYKLASKEIGNFAPIKSEVYETLYKLDDEIFFKYAVPVEPDKEGNKEEG